MGRASDEKRKIADKKRMERQKAMPAKALAIAEQLAAAEISARKPLTERQAKFVELVARHGMQPVAALVSMGVKSPKINAAHMARSLNVQRAIQREQELAEKAGLMTKKKVLDGFLEAIDMARTLADPVAMTGGWREIAKMCGYYEPTKHKLEVSVNGQVVIQKLQQLDDEQLLKLADGNADALEGEFKVIQGD